MTDPATPDDATKIKTIAVASWRERALADARNFISELETLRQADRGRMAQLRRNAGEPLPGRGTSWFYRYLAPPQRQRNGEIHFLVATLFDLNRKHSIVGDFGRAVRQAASTTSEESMQRRFRILLDADFDTISDPLNENAHWQEGGGELAFRLRQMVKLLASKEIGVDWAELLVDLCQWSYQDKPVQKKWARSFFKSYTAPQETTPNAAVETTDPPTE
jgi:CRISPR system Cascade subunit CasB